VVSLQTHIRMSVCPPPFFFCKIAVKDMLQYNFVREIVCSWLIVLCLKCISLKRQIRLVGGRGRDLAGSGESRQGASYLHSNAS
jgi:hypothetical protein